MVVVVLLVMVMMVQIAFPFDRGHVTVGVVLWYTEYTVYAVPVVEVTSTSGNATAADHDGRLLGGGGVGDHRHGTLLLLLLLLLLVVLLLTGRWSRATVAIAVLLVMLVLLLAVVYVFRFFCRLVSDDPVTEEKTTGQKNEKQKEKNAARFGIINRSHSARAYLTVRKRDIIVVAVNLTVGGRASETLKLPPPRWYDNNNNNNKPPLPPLVAGVRV